MELIILFFGIPIAVTAWCVSSILRYVNAKKASKADPGAVSAEELKERKRWMIVSAVAAGFLVAAVVAVIVLLMTAIAFM